MNISASLTSVAVAKHFERGLTANAVACQFKVYRKDAEALKVAVANGQDPKSISVGGSGKNSE